MPIKPDYRKLRLNNILSGEFSYLLYLIFWPLWGVLFSWLESRDNIYYTIIECDLDSVIPFCEYFAIPYVFWFVFLFGMLVYGLFFDVECFRKMMNFIIITYLTTAIIYILWPSKQMLRPTVFERNNFFTRYMAMFYAFDTNTNVCPSLHVIGSFAALFAGWHSHFFGKTGWRITFTIITILICLSTVFLKQHSAVDSAPAIVISFATYYFLYYRKAQKNLAKQKQNA